MPHSGATTTSFTEQRELAKKEEFNRFCGSS